jgi:hypothetical protein
LKRDKGMKKEKEPLLLLNLDKSGPPPAPETLDSETSPDNVGFPAPPPEPPALSTVQKKPWLLSDVLRMLLVILSLVVAAGFILILLPQPSVDKMTQDLQARQGKNQPEQISLLYLGDETKDSEFHVRGAVRNITTAPIEKLDAAVRVYAHDGNILETTVLRMNKETIAPDEVAQFELVYPNYKGEFAKYSVEFKLRDGGIMPYKDMRAAR